MGIDGNKRASLYKQKLLDEIHSDNKLGSAELAHLALSGISEYSTLLHPRSGEELRDALITTAEQLRDARPSMAAMKNALNRWLERFQHTSSSSVLSVVSEAARITESMQSESEKAIQTIARFTRELIEPSSTIMTHSYSATIAHALRQIENQQMEVIVSESRPGMEGAKMAKLLGKNNIHTHFITDAQIGVFANKADVILLGADAVLADGSLVNKSGSYLLALAAAQQRIPVYVCCESYKFSEELPETLVLEHRTSAELHIPNSPMITSHNIYFDITPPHLISGYITETGISRPTIQNAPH